MEKDELLPCKPASGGRAVLTRHKRATSLGESLSSGGGSGSGAEGMRGGIKLERRRGSYDAVWNTEVSTAIGRDLVGKAERWKILAGEAMTGPPPQIASHGGFSILPEIGPPVSHGIDKHELASFYVKDALAGRESPICILDPKCLEALRLVRNKTWNHLLNVCTVIHLIMPIVEIQRCLPCMGIQQLIDTKDADSLHQGWRPTPLGSMWLECAMCLFYAYDLYQVRISRSTYERTGGNGKLTRRFASKIPPWQLARVCMVFILWSGLVANIVAHYVFRITWHRWTRVLLPFLFISRRTYLKHFVSGMVRVLPRMTPVFFLMSFVGFFYAFLGYVFFRGDPRDESFLTGLPLFDRPGSSAMTFLRIFMSIPFMLDTEKKYGGRTGIQVLGLSCGMIMVVFMGALVPAVANRAFKQQSGESYTWVKEQRKLALTRAYLLLEHPGGTVDRDDWAQLMSFLRPDCDPDHTSALFDAANKATRGGGGGGDVNKVSKEGFFMLCALGRAKFSQRNNNREEREMSSSSGRGRSPVRAAVRPPGLWMRIRMRLRKALAWCLPGMNFPLSELLFNLSVLLQEYQIVKEGDSPEERPAWAYSLGKGLIAYFCAFSAVRMAAAGPVAYFKQWRHALGLSLNLVGVAYHVGLWFPGQEWHSVYIILQASRLCVLWHVLHRIGPTTAEVATRLEYVFPSVLRASFVLFSVTYSYSVVAFALYCDTPLGILPAEGVKDDSMMQRWMNFKDVISFRSLLESFTSMMDVIMLGCWTIFSDAAADVGNPYVSAFFFYSFKGLTFYFVMPVMLGFIVQSYMAAQIPESEPPPPPLLAASPSDGGSGLWSKVTSQGGGSGDEGSGKASPRRGSATSNDSSSSRSRRGSLNSGFGYSAIVDIGEKELEADDAGSDDDDRCDEDQPVVITSDSRSISQAFWGAEQAKDDEGGVEASTMQETIIRLETEVSSLRELVDSLQMNQRIANAKQHNEKHGHLQASSKKGHRWTLGIDKTTIGKAVVPGSAPVRQGSGNLPVRQGSGNLPVRQGSGNLPVRQGSGNLPVRQESENRPVRQGSGDLPVRQGSGNLPVRQESENRPVRQGSGDLPVRQASGNAVGGMESIAEMN